jgi:hypothetical protein
MLARAIKLYNQIIVTAGKEGDDKTERPFRRILPDEEGHHRTFFGFANGNNEGELGQRNVDSRSQYMKRFIKH